MSKTNIPLDNNQGLPTLDELELSFEGVGEEVINTELKEDKEKEEVIVETQEQKKATEEVKLETTTFEDLEISESEKPEKSVEPDYLAAIRAVLEKKMVRYGVDSEEHDLLNLDEEGLIDFEERLDNAIISNRYNSVKNQNKHIKAIMDYAENGGNPEEITSLFQQQNELQEIDKESKDGKVQYIKSYYKDALGWDSNKVNQRIERLEASDNIENEFNDVAPEYDRYFEQAVEAKQQKQREIQNRRVALEKRREEMFKTVLDDVKVSNKLKNDYLQTAFSEGTIRGTEEKIKVFDYRIEAMKNDPQQFLKLVQFLTDPEQYDKNIAQLAKNEKVETKSRESFNMSQKQKESTTVEENKNKRPQFKFNFN